MTRLLPLLLLLTALNAGASTITTDKALYTNSEPITVTFTGATGASNDWLIIVHNGVIPTNSVGVDWRWTDCTQTGGGSGGGTPGITNGACTFTNGIALTGVYDAWLLPTNSYFPRLAGPATFTVSPLPQTYYIDYASGNDTNSGTSKLAPWQHAPQMTNTFTGSYTHGIGDSFIFKGGVTWGVTNFQMHVKSGGSAATPDYYGVDKTWFTGGLWTRPVFDFEHTVIDPNGFEANSAVFLDQVNYVTIDGLELKNFRIVNGSAAQKNFNILAQNSDFITITNCVIHDWDYAGSPPLPDGQDGNSAGGVANSGSSIGGTTEIVTHCLLHCDNTTIKCGTAITSLQPMFTEVRGVPQVYSGSGLCHDNNFHDPVYSSDPTAHGNTIITFGPSTIYNNLIHDLPAGTSCMLLHAGGSEAASWTDLIYNNVIWNTGNQAPITVDTFSIAAPTSGAMIYNNTLAAITGIAVGNRGGGHPGLGWLDVRNNLLISDQTSGNPICYNGGIPNCGTVLGGVTNAFNLILTPAAASAAGYTIANQFAPTALGSPSVNVGTALAAFSTDILSTNRPQLGAWDAGAYEFFTSLTNFPPATPANVSPASGAVNVSVTPLLSASAYSDPNPSVQTDSQWRVFQTGFPVWDSGSAGVVTSKAVTSPLLYGISYTWSVRYQNALGLWSAWSAQTAFTTTNGPPPGGRTIAIISGGAAIIGGSIIP